MVGALWRDISGLVISQIKKGGYNNTHPSHFIIFQKPNDSKYFQSAARSAQKEKKYRKTLSPVHFRW